jgi:uncharacterized membrane protein
VTSAPPPPRGPGRWAPLSVLLATAGLAHLVRPGGFDAIVPRSLPGRPRTWTLGSGLVELALAAGLALPATRRATGTAAAGFFLAVWPANVKMALDARPGTRRRAVALVRLPLQVPLVRAAWRAGR